MKTKRGNNVTDRTGVVYIKNDTKLLWSIGRSVDDAEN